MDRPLFNLLIFIFIAEFNIWKREEEEKNYSMFVHKRTKKSNENKKLYYYCTQSCDVLKRRKKINGTCPSMIVVTLKTSEKLIHVKFWENHCGHNQEKIELDETKKNNIGIPIYELI